MQKQVLPCHGAIIYGENVFSNDSGITLEIQIRSFYSYIFLRNLKVPHDAGKKTTPKISLNIKQVIYDALVLLLFF